MERGEDDYIYPFELVALCVDPDNSGLVYRPLRRRDYHAGYLALLSQLTTVGHIDQAAFESKYTLTPIYCDRNNNFNS